MEVESITPWVEKHRPISLSNVNSQPQAITTLSQMVATKDVPHLLFHGPPGSGKTSTALALARDLYGDTMSANVLELNASDERGIKVVRDRVKVFANTSSTADFKVVILDEADSMTQDAQSALRRIIENFSSITRFILICNYVSRISEPLCSRCAKFRFTPVSVDSISARLRSIAHSEGIMDTEVIDYIATIVNGDMRRAVMLLQSSSALNASISQQDVEEMAGYMPTHKVQTVFAAVMNGDVDQCVAAAKTVMDDGYNCMTVLKQLIPLVLARMEKPEHYAEFSTLCGYADKNVCNGGNEYIQFLNVVLTLNAFR